MFDLRSSVALLQDAKNPGSELSKAMEELFFFFKYRWVIRFIWICKRDAMFRSILTSLYAVRPCSSQANETFVKLYSLRCVNLGETYATSRGEDKQFSENNKCSGECLNAWIGASV